MASPDKLTIETPEQTPLEFSLAGIGSRFLALAADTAIQLLLLFGLAAVAMSAIPLARLAGMLSLWAIAGLIIGGFLVYEGYFAFFEAVWNGQTPGKRLAGLRVIKDDGRPIGAYDAVARNLLRIVDQLPGVYAVGIVVMLFSRQSKRLGDHVAGTVVVRERAFGAARPFSGAAPEASPRTLDISGISIEEFQLLETFLQRRDSIGPDARRQMAARIVRRLAPKAGLAPQPWPESEKFIENLYEQVRARGLRS